MAVGRGGRRRHVPASLPRALRLRVPELAALERELALERRRLRNAVLGGYAVAIVDPDPVLVPLPSPPALDEGRSFGPVSAPTGGGRYFAYGIAGVYDRQEDSWTLSRFPDYANSYSAPWGATHRETRYSFLDGLRATHRVAAAAARDRVPPVWR